MHTLGLDIGKDEVVAFLLDDEGQPIYKTSKAFPQTAAGHRRLLKWLPNAECTRVLFESTGVYSKALVKALDGCVGSLHELNPRTLKHMAVSMTQTKTDHADARAIAEIGHLLALTRPEVLQKRTVAFDEQAQNVAAWLSEYDRLRANIAALKCQIEDIGLNPAPAARQIRTRRQAELRLLEARLDHAKAQIQAALDAWKCKDAELLLSIKGVGPLTAAAILTKTRTIDRFDSADAFKAYFGVYPRQNQSGRRNAPARMATHGCALVRHMLWNAARVAARFNPVCRQLFERLRSAGRAVPACYGAVARKLLQIIYGVLKNQRPFDPTLGLQPT